MGVMNPESKRQATRDDSGSPQHTPLLPKEVIAVVQHIELNKAGWWEKTIDRLMLSSVWLAGKPLSAEEIGELLNSDFKISIGHQRLEGAVRRVCARGHLIQISPEKLKISETYKKEFEKDLSESEAVEKNAKDSFCAISKKHGLDADVDKSWRSFEINLLGPVIKHIGAGAYHLLSGRKLSVEVEALDPLLRKFPAEQREKLRVIFAEYLDPKNDAARAYVSRMLHALFCVDASGLPEEVLSKLNSSSGKHARFVLFVDTNFLFSLLDLHENPANAAAQELRALISRLKGNPRIDLYIRPETIREAKTSISSAMSQLSGFPMGSRFSEAGISAGFSGMALKYLLERELRNVRPSVDTWFEPYLNDFVPLARGKGVEIFNENFDAYSMRQDVIDDINDVMRFEKRYPELRRKSYEKIRHDVVLWHVVNDKRPSYLESPIDANYWILTIDNRLIAFDEHKKRRDNAKIPLCVHPTSLIQLLQFWVPRSREFEEAVLGGLRMPFIYQHLDAEAEKTSVRILKGIGRFDGSDNLSSETIAQVMLNEGLRSRLQSNGGTADEELQLIRDALVEAEQARADSQEKKAKEAIAEADRQRLLAKEIAEQAEVLQRQHNKELSESQSSALNRINQQEEELKSIKEELKVRNQRDEMAAREAVAKAELRSKYVRLSFFVFGVALVSTAAIYAIDAFIPKAGILLGKWPSRIIVGACSFVSLSLIERWCFGKFLAPVDSHLLKLYNFIIKWTGIILFSFLLVGVGINLYSNYIQKNIDSDNGAAKSN